MSDLTRCRGHEAVCSDESAGAKLKVVMVIDL